MRDLIDELRALQQEGVWGGIKKAAKTAADVADTAVSSIPVVGDVYNAGIGAYHAGKAAYNAGKGVGQWATGQKKAAASSFKKAKSSGIDAVGRGVMAAASTIGAGGAAKIAGRSIVKPLVKTAISAGVKTAGKAAVDASNAPPKKKKPAVAPASESTEFLSPSALLEFRALAGMPPLAKEPKKQVEEGGSKDAV